MISDELVYSKLEDSIEKSIELEKELEISFENLQRLNDTHEILTEWITNCKDDVSMESSKKSIIKLALAGTDFKVDEVSMESVIELVKSIGKAIIRAIKKMFDTLVDYFTNMDLTATWLIRLTKMLERRRVTSRGRIPKNINVTLPASHRFLRVGRVFTEQPVKLNTELRRYRDLLKIVSNDYPSAVASVVKDIVIKTNGKFGDELEQPILDAVNSSKFNTIAGRLRMSKTPTSRWGYDNVKETDPYLGGRSLFYFDGNLSERRLAGLRRHGFRFDDTLLARFKEEKSKDFVSLTTSTLEGIPQILEEMLRIISNSSTKNVSRSLKESKDSIDKWVNAKMSSDKSREEDMMKLRQVSNVIMSWSRTVTGPIFGNALQVIRAVITYGNASMSNLK